MVLGTLAIVLLVTALVAITRSYPDPVEPWKGWLAWQEHWIGLRMSLREMTWEVTAMIMGLVGLISLAQVPAKGSDLEDHAYRTVGQAISWLAAFTLAIYGWLSLPVSSEEVSAFASLINDQERPEKDDITAVAPFGIPLVLLAGALSVVMSGGSRMQRAKSASFLRSRRGDISRRVEQLGLLSRGEGARSLLGWHSDVRMGWVKSLSHAFVNPSRPKELRLSSLFRLITLRPLVLMCVAWCIWNLVWGLRIYDPSVGLVAFVVLVSSLLYVVTLVLFLLWSVISWETPSRVKVYVVFVGAWSCLAVFAVWFVSATLVDLEIGLFVGNVVLAVAATLVVALLRRACVHKIDEIERRFQLYQIRQTKGRLANVEAQKRFNF